MVIISVERALKRNKEFELILLWHNERKHLSKKKIVVIYFFMSRIFSIVLSRIDKYIKPDFGNIPNKNIFTEKSNLSSHKLSTRSKTISFKCLFSKFRLLNDRCYVIRFEFVDLSLIGVRSKSFFLTEGQLHSNSIKKSRVKAIK